MFAQHSSSTPWVCVVVLSLLFSLYVRSSPFAEAGVCNRVSNNDACSQKSVYSCVSPSSPDCQPTDVCGIDYNRNFRTGSVIRIYVGSFEVSLSTCPSGFTNADDLGIITEALYMFTGDTPCFRTNQASLSGSSVSLGTTTYTNFTTFGSGYFCASEKLFFKCNSGQMTMSVGSMGYTFSLRNGFEGYSKTSNLCYSWSSAYAPIRRGTQLIEDMFVDAQVTRTAGANFCQSWGGTLMRATIPSVSSIIGQVGTGVTFHVGYDSGTWTYDQTPYSSNTDPPLKGATGANEVLQGSDKTLRKLSSDLSRFSIVCTRTMSDVILTVPAKCYVALVCIVTGTSTLTVQRYHTVSDSDLRVRYTSGASTIFEFSLGGSMTSTYQTTMSTVGASASTTAYLSGQGFVASVAFTLTAYALEGVTIPTGLTLYRGVTNTFQVTKTSVGSIDSISTTSGTNLTGVVSVASFSGVSATVTVTPTNAAGSFVTVVFAVSSRCDCGYVCACYASPTTFSGIPVVDPAAIGANASSLLILPSQQITVTVTLPLTPLYSTTVAVASVCGLAFSSTSLSWTTGASSLSQAFTVTAPSTITSVQSCALVFSVNQGSPQYYSPASLPVVVGPAISVLYQSLQSSMTQGASYTFQILLSRVYTGRNVSVTPVCSAATFTPAMQTFSSSVLSQSFSIVGNAASCTLTTSFGDTGATDVTAPTARSLSFTNLKTIQVSAPSLLYVGQTSSNVITLLSTFTGSEYVDVAFSWNGTAGSIGFSSSSPVTLNSATPTINITLTSGSGSVGYILFTASTTYTTAFDTNMAPLPLEVRVPLVTSTSPAAVPINMSTDTYYALTLVVDVGRLPAVDSTNVTVTLSYPLMGYFNVTPSSLVWRASDSSYSTKAFTVVGLLPTDSAAFSFVVTSSSPEFKTGTFALGSTKVYTRFIVAPSTSAVTVYGSPIAFRIPVVLTGPPTVGSLVLQTAYSATEVTGPNTITINSTTTSFTWSLTTIRTITAGVTFDALLSIGSASSAGVASFFDTRINSTKVTILPYRAISVICNSTTLFYGPNNAISCVFMLAAAPATGVTLQLALRVDSSVTSSPTSASFAGVNLTFVLSPALSHTFVDGASQTVAMSVADTSSQYNPADIVVTFTKRALRTVTLSLLDPSVRLYRSATTATQNPFILCASTSQQPDQVTTINTTVSGVTSNASMIAFTPTSALTVCVEWKVPIAAALTIQFPVSASPKFASTTNALVLSVRELESVMLTLNASLLFVGQGLQLTITSTGSVASAGTITATPTVYCSGTQSSPINWTTPIVVDLTSATSGTISGVAATPCVGGTLTLTLSGSSTIFDLTASVSASFSIKPLKALTVALSKGSLYGGGQDTSLLSVAVSNLPETGTLSVLVEEVSTPTRVQFTVTSLAFSTGATNRSTSVTGSLVTAVVTTSLRLTFSGTALAEFTFPSSNVYSLAINPILNVSYAINFSPAVIYVGSALAQNMTVTLPVAPQSGSVVITPLFVSGSPTSVKFTPSSVTLNSTSLTGVFTVEALASTSSNEALSVTYSGDAVGYFPQPTATNFPVRFQSPGVVRFLNTVPSSVFASQSFALDVEISFAPPSSYGPVTVNIASNSSSLIPSPSSVQWTSTSTVLQTTFTVQAVSQQKYAKLTFSLTAPVIYMQTMSVTSAIVSVASTRDILVAIPAFAYVGQTVTGTVEIGVLPPTGTKLSIVVTPSNGQAASLSTLFDFTSTSAKTQSFSIQALRASGLIYLMLSIVDGSQYYDSPAAQPIEIRALDVVNASGLTAGMYVGVAAVLTFQIARDPQCDSGGSISIVPVFGSGDASFSPSAGVTFTVGGGILSKSVVLTAVQTSAGSIPVSLPITGNCKSIYAAVSTTTSSVRIYPREKVTLSSLSNMSDPSDGAYFTYVGSTIPLTIDVGTPSIPHSGLTFKLAFAGAVGTIAFSSDTVVLPAGVNKTIVNVTGLVDTSAADLSVVVTTAGGIFVPVGPIRFKVLLKIPVSLSFVPSSQLVVVATTLTLSVTVGSSALVGSMFAQLGFEVAGCLNSTTVEFRAGGSELTQSLVVQGLVPSNVTGNLSLVLSGPAGPFYFPTTASFQTIVRPQRFVALTAPPKELFIASANKRIVEVRLQSLPTLANDVITVSHISSTSVVATPSTITLTSASPSAYVTLQGTAVGSFVIANIFGARSTSNEYSSVFNNTATPIPVLGLITLTLQGYLTSMYVSSSQNFTVVVPRAPLNPLTVQVTLPGSSYALVCTPTSLVFSSTAPLTQSITIAATSSVMPASAMQITTSGSSEFDAVGYTATLEVKPDNDVAFSGWMTSVYIGSTNAITFSVSVARLPTGNNNLTISLPSSEFYELSQTSFRFGPGTGLVLEATFRGLVASSTELALAVTMHDPTGFFVQPVPLMVTVLALEVYSGSVSGTLVYEQETMTVTLTLPQTPSGPMGVTLTVQKNRTSNSLVDVSPTLYDVSPSVSQSIPTTATSVTFTIKPLTSPLTVQLSFITSGDATSEYFIMTIPAFVVRFAALYPIVLGAPAFLYRGLETTFPVTVAIAPPTGAIAVSFDASGAGIATSPSSVQFDVTTSTTLNFSATASTLGSFSIPITTAVMSVVGFQKSTQPATWLVTVQEPYPLDLVDPPAYVYAYAANTISLTVDYGTLGAGETITVTLTSNASDYLSIFPTSLEVSTSTPVFTVYALEPVWVQFNLTYVSSARRVVLGSRLVNKGLIVNFRALKTVSIVAPSAQSATIGQGVSVAIVVSEKPSPNSVLIAQLQYGGSPSNINLPPATQWDSSAVDLTRTLTFSGRSPTSLQSVTVVLSNDPQYETTSYSFSFQFEALLQVTVDMPLVVFVNQSAAFTLSLASSVSLSVTLSVSPLGVLVISPSNTLNMVLQSSVTGYMIPSQARDVTISFALSADDAARVAVPAARKVQVATASQVIVNAPSSNMVVYIKNTIYLRTTVQLSVAPPNGSTVTVTPQLSCPAGNIVTFTPSFVSFNSSAVPVVLSKSIDLRGVIASPACSLLYAVSGDGYTSSAQSLTVETRNLHTIQLINVSSRIFLGTANRIVLNISLDSSVSMPLSDSISVTFATSSPCLTISPSALYWAPDNQEDLSKTAYVTATCLGTGLTITTTVSASNIFTNLVPSTIVLSALALQTITVTETSSSSTDYFMFVGGSGLDFDVVIPEALADGETVTVTALYSGIAGSISVAAAVWSPSPLKPLTKKLLIQAVSVSPQAPITFAVTGPPRFRSDATGDGELEVFGPKRVTATVATSLVVGEVLLVKVTIEELPYPTETIVVVPTWEGANTSLSWTPPSIQWTSSTVSREQFFQFTALQQSGDFNLNLDVSGSYRFVSSAYSGELTITVPQTITTTQLPLELTKGIGYSINVNVGKLPLASDTDLYVRIEPGLSDLGLDCIQLAATEVHFSSADPLAPVEQQVGVSVVRPCPMREMTFTVLGAVEQYSRIVAPRYFITLAYSPFGVEWPVAMYAGSEPQSAVLTLREVIYDQSYFVNVSISCNGSASFTQELYWGYGSKSEVFFDIANNVSEDVVFNFTVTSNFLWDAVIPDHITSFLPLIDIRQVTAVPAQIYMGDANKLQVMFNVSSLPVQLGNTPGATFSLVPETMAPEVTIQPTELTWSADSSPSQFMYIVGLAPTSGPVEILFRVAGDGAGLIGEVPASVWTEISPLLLVNYTVAPKGVYIGSSNVQTVNVTVPDSSNISLVLSVGGETTAYTLTPSTLNFVAGGPRTMQFTIEGMYATSRASYMLYTIASAPPRIALRTMDASESMTVLALQTVTQTPDILSYSIVVGESVSVVISPPIPNVRCTTATASFAVVYLNSQEIRVTALSAGYTVITCTIPDTTYDGIVPFSVTAIPKKTISYLSSISTYVVIPGQDEAQQTLGITVSSLPSKDTLVVEPLFNATILKFPLLQLQFGPYTAKTQYFFVKGLMLTNSTNISFVFSGSTSEYDVSNLPITKCEVINSLTVSYSLLGALTDSSGNYYGYISQVNALRVQFTIPRQTLFASIQAIPANSDVRYCSSVSPCVPISAGNPTLIGTSLRVTAYIFSATVVTNRTISFALKGGVDFKAPATITIPNVDFRPLEKVVIDTSSCRPVLYFGGQNLQTIIVSITAAPLAGQSVELIVTSTSGIVLSTPLLTFATSSAGELVNAMTQSVTVTGSIQGDNQSISFQWRDRTAITSASNFQDAIPNQIVYFTVSPLIVFQVAVEGVLLSTGYRTTPYTIYVGEVNALAVTITLPTMPVLSSTLVTVSITISNPDVFQGSSTSALFSQVGSYATPTKTIQLYAKKALDSSSANNTVTIRISGPPEYQQDAIYAFSVLAQPLLTMMSSLSTSTIAVGGENSITFSIWPPVPVTLSLSSIVTCGEISFSSLEALSWDNSMDKKSVSVVGTMATTASSSCFIRTPILTGSWASKFVSPPLDLQLWTKARPAVSSDVAASTPGTDIRDTGLTFTVTLSGGGYWLFNQTTTTFTSWVQAGLVKVSSTRGANLESRSIMAALDDQLSGRTQTPLITMTIPAANRLKVAIGPNSDFYASARETVTFQFTRSCTSTGVTLEPNSDFIEFEIKGKKEALVSSNVLGSSAASAAIAGGALSMGAATASGKMQAIMNAFLCPNPDWRDNQNSMDWNEAPIPLSFGSNEDLGTYTAVAFANSIVIFGCFCLHMAVALCVYRWRQSGGYSDKTWNATLSVVRFPSLLLFPMLFFYQSVVSASIKAILYSPVLTFQAIGGVAFVIVGFGIPGVVYAAVGPGAKDAIFIPREELVEEQARQKRHARLAAESYARHNELGDETTEVATNDKIDDDSNGSESDDGAMPSSAETEANRMIEQETANQSILVRTMLYVFQYEGEWSHPDKMWIGKFGMFFDEFRGGYKWFIMVDLLLTFGLGITDGVEPTTKTGCYGRLAVSILIFLLQWLSVTYFRPYINRFINVFFIFVFFIQFLAMLLVAAALFADEPNSDEVSFAVYLLIFFAALLLIKSVLDLLRVANEHLGIDAVFGDNDGLTAVRIRTKTEKEDRALEEEMFRCLLPDKGRQKPNAYDTEGVSRVGRRPLLLLEEIESNSDPLDYGECESEQGDDALADFTDQDGREVGDLNLDLNDHGVEGLLGEEYAQYIEAGLEETRRSQKESRRRRR